MEMRKVLLNHEDFQQYLAGNEVECPPDQLVNGVRTGDHIIVYKNSVASVVDAAVPTREKQADYIGVEGTVTQVNHLHPVGDRSQRLLQTVYIKKL
jgi:hypothetical protein